MSAPATAPFQAKNREPGANYWHKPLGFPTARAGC
jgi:hypothetical protein